MTKASLMFLVAIAIAVMMAQPVSAAALTSVVDDAVGDVTHHGPAFQDIVQAAITLKDGRFIFVMDLAAPLPDTPVLPDGIVLLNWLWIMDSDPAFPRGFPFQPGTTGPAEFHIRVIWDGSSFTGIVIDRRPLITGGEAIITSVSFSIKEAKVTVSADAALLGDPSSFIWTARTEFWRTPFGSNSYKVLDFAPDSHKATWPS